MGRTADSFREVVSPDRGASYATPADAVTAMLTEGWRATSDGIYFAIEFGLPYCGRYFDWRFPPDWPKSRRRAAERPKQEVHA